ncbi:MAG TPA: hypothetical protein VL984_04215 [Acidimicrobiales bacterium]|nr:hypothetical protein [Acidimicrobiales bacterium]
MSEVVDPAGQLLGELDARMVELRRQLDETTDRAAKRKVRRQVRSLLLRSVREADKVRAGHGEHAGRTS